MKIVLLEPFFTGSHAAWANDYARCSRHQVTILSLPGRHWKWRMHGGAVVLARQYLDQQLCPDLLLATDMLDLTTFLALTRTQTAQCRTAVYFHENQLTYPWSPDDADTSKGRDIHYAFINYSSALAADAVFFNSCYHFDSFFEGLSPFLRSMPDKREWGTIEAIRSKSRVLSLGMDLERLDPFRTQKSRRRGGPPLVLWNHRWEYDKNPDQFFNTLERIAARGIDFRLAILGQNFAGRPAVFDTVRERFGDRLVHLGFAASLAEYAHWLWQADILPVTSFHDFFGASVVEAIYCGCYPLLPKRLAYPEHLPDLYHGSCFYQDDEELDARLETLLKDPLPHLPEALQHAVHHYDWKTMVSIYDELLENVVISNGRG